MTETDVTQPEPVRKKIVIVDDHPAIREGLAMCIELEEDLEVCGQACDDIEALRVIQDTKPDVAIIDVALKTGNGIELVKQLSARNDPPLLLVWSMYDESLYAMRALRAGALGYVNKQSETNTVIEAIRHVLQKEIYLSPEASKQLLNQAVRGQDVNSESAVHSLSDRELQIFELIGRGRTTHQIADQLHLSPKTVETHRGRIKTKLNVSSATELIQQATQWVLENG